MGPSSYTNREVNAMHPDQAIAAVSLGLLTGSQMQGLLGGPSLTPRGLLRALLLTKAAAEANAVEAAKAVAEAQAAAEEAKAVAVANTAAEGPKQLPRPRLLRRRPKRLPRPRLPRSRRPQRLRRPKRLRRLKR